MLALNGAFNASNNAIKPLHLKGYRGSKSSSVVLFRTVPLPFTHDREIGGGGPEKSAVSRGAAR